jgi:hypothetical protein
VLCAVVSRVHDHTRLFAGCVSLVPSDDQLPQVDEPSTPNAQERFDEVSVEGGTEGVGSEWPRHGLASVMEEAETGVCARRLEAA